MPRKAVAVYQLLPPFDAYDDVRQLGYAAGRKEVSLENTIEYNDCLFEGLNIQTKQLQLKHIFWGSLTGMCQDQNGQVFYRFDKKIDAFVVYLYNETAHEYFLARVERVFKPMGAAVVKAKINHKGDA